MSARVSKVVPAKVNGRSKRGLHLDLNDPPIVDQDPVGTSGERQASQAAPTSQQANITQISSVGVLAPISGVIAVEESHDTDDEVVVISSPRAFEEAARNKPRRVRPRVYDIETSSVTCGGYSHLKHRRVEPNQPIIVDCESYTAGSGERGNCGRSNVQPPAAPPSPPRLCCPVCMHPFVEEVSTKCGHIFCKECIKMAIAAQKKCPTCRRKLAMKDVIRIYLPTTN